MGFFKPQKNAIVKKTSMKKMGSTMAIFYLLMLAMTVSPIKNKDYPIIPCDYPMVVSILGHPWCSPGWFFLVHPSQLGKLQKLISLSVVGITL